MKDTYGGGRLEAPSFAEASSFKSDGRGLTSALLVVVCLELCGRDIGKCPHQPMVVETRDPLQSGQLDSLHGCVVGSGLHLII